MVRLTRLPEQAIIDSLKGVVDFYYCMGIPCARKWPHWPKRDPLPLEKANQDAFGYASRAYNRLPPYVKQQYINMVAGLPFTARDLFTRAYLAGNRP